MEVYRKSNRIPACVCMADGSACVSGGKVVCVENKRKKLFCKVDVLDRKVVCKTVSFFCISNAIQYKFIELR